MRPDTHKAPPQPRSTRTPQVSVPSAITTADTVQTPLGALAFAVFAIASLAQRDGGLVTVRGKVAEVYGDRFTIVDSSGKAMVDAVEVPVTVKHRTCIDKVESY